MTVRKLSGRMHNYIFNPQSERVGFMTLQNKRLPAEWEPQTAVLLTWPHALGAWGEDYVPVEKVFVRLVEAITATEQVIIGVYDAIHQNAVLALLHDYSIDLSRVFTYIAPSNDVWARDHGPITLIDHKQTLLCHFQFNGWGNKFPHDLDTQIPERLFASRLLPYMAFRAHDFILEGGSLETDGQGTLLTTSSCLCSPERNGGLTEAQVESFLQKTLGLDRVLWLHDGHLMGDDTDGHIDTLARFLNKNTIAYVHCDDQNDPHYASLKAMRETLATFTDRDNQPYKLVPLPLPRAIFDDAGKRLPATYANFLIINEQVLVPTYQDPLDQSVLNTLQDHFPDRRVVGIDCLPIIEQYGSLHCLTMQIPQGDLNVS